MVAPAEVTGIFYGDLTRQFDQSITPGLRDTKVRLLGMANSSFTNVGQPCPIF
jgi:hypothetical protein